MFKNSFYMNQWYIDVQSKYKFKPYLLRGEGGGGGVGGRWVGDIVLLFFWTLYFNQ